MTVKVINRSRNGLPAYSTPFAAGMDVRADLSEPVVLAPLERAAVPTGLYLEIPAGYEVQVRPRSGLAAKKGVTVLKSAVTELGNLDGRRKFDNYYLHREKE